jgi:hypothetical protein
MKKILLILLSPMLIVFVVISLGFRAVIYAIAWVRLALNIPDRVDSGESDYDQELKIRQRTTKPALRWLSENQKNSIYGFSNRRSQRIIKSIIRKEAVEVYALDIEDSESGGYSRALLIELPENAKSRRRLFDWEYLRAAVMSFSGVIDNGQKYIFTYWT